MSGKGGYIYDFVDTVPEDYTCSICHHPMRNPHQLISCGHRFCKECLQQLVGDGHNCPIDRSHIDKQTVFADTAFNREIVNLHIYCTNRAKGCNWQNSLISHQHHLETCGFEIIRCSLTGCNHEMERRYFRVHIENECSWRLVPCEYCKNDVVFSSLEQHKESCDCVPLDCPNECKEMLIRRMITHHISAKCPRTIIDCPYSEFGCHFQVPRQLLAQHQKNHVHEHLSLTRQTVFTLQKCVRELERNIAQFNFDGAHPYCFIWKINDVFVNMPSLNQPYVHYASDPFVVPGSSGFKLCGVCTLSFGLCTLDTKDVPPAFFFGILHSTLNSQSTRPSPPPPVYVTTWVAILDNMKFSHAEWPNDKLCKITIGNEALQYVTGHVIPKRTFNFGHFISPGHNLVGQKSESRQFFVQIEVPMMRGSQ